MTLILPCLSSSVLPVMLSGQWAEAIVTTLANIWWTQSHQNHLPNAWLSHRASNAWQLWKSCCSHSNCFVLINSGSCYCDSPLCSMAQRRHGTAKCSSAGRHIVESMAAEEVWERRVEVETLQSFILGPGSTHIPRKHPRKHPTSSEVDACPWWCLSAHAPEGHQGKLLVGKKMCWRLQGGIFGKDLNSVTTEILHVSSLLILVSPGVWQHLFSLQSSGSGYTCPSEDNNQGIIW